MPSQIAAAHTIFLSNAGADNHFPIDATEAYNSIYAALASWGRYRLVGAPEEADLVFTLRDVAPGTTVNNGQDTSYTYFSPGYQVTISDPNSNVMLWTVNSPVNLAGRKKVRERWEALSVTDLVSRLKVLAGEPLSATESADLTLAPKSHFGRYVAIGSVAFAGVAVGSYFLVHHLYENGLAEGKAQQDAFCAANHIPLSQCAGG